MSSFCGAHYFLNIIDHSSRAVCLHLIKDKGEAINILKNFVAFVKNQFGKNMKIIRTDNGSRFASGPMKKFYLGKEFFTKSIVLIPHKRMVG